MGLTLARTIRDLSAEHIRKGGLVIGQCLSAVGWVGGTVPDDQDLRHGIIELPMTDIAGAGIAVGAALGGARPILVIRFQSFLWLNASPLVNYAAKSKAIFGYDCPVFVRAIASENCGPIHTGYHDYIFDRVDGLAVVRPHTPREYREVWQRFLDTGIPTICSEHRDDYGNVDS